MKSNSFYKWLLGGVALVLIVKGKASDIASKIRFGLKSIRYVGFEPTTNPVTGQKVKAAKFTASLIFTNKNAETLKITRFVARLFYGVTPISILDLNEVTILGHNSAIASITIYVSVGDVLTAIVKLITGSISSDSSDYSGLHVAGSCTGSYSIVPFTANFDEPVIFNFATLAESNDMNIEQLRSDLLNA